LREKSSLIADAVDKANITLLSFRAEMDKMAREQVSMQRLIEKQSEEILVYQLDQGLKIPRKNKVASIFNNIPLGGLNKK
jgi:hypothetical protein